jgi:hypothetical protein
MTAAVVKSQPIKKALIAEGDCPKKRLRELA